MFPELFPDAPPPYDALDHSNRLTGLCSPKWEQYEYRNRVLLSARTAPGTPSKDEMGGKEGKRFK